MPPPEITMSDGINGPGFCLNNIHRRADHYLRAGCGVAASQHHT
jgi:hypothetical protein